MREYEISTSVRFGITCWSACLLALIHQRLKIIRHRVAIDRIIVPGLETQTLAQFFTDELTGIGDARIVPSIVADLKHESRARDELFELFALLDLSPQRLLDQHMLARF